MILMRQPVAAISPSMIYGTARSKQPIITS